MKTIIRVLPAMILIALSVSSCENDKETHQQPYTDGRLISHSICKSFEPHKGTDVLSDSLSCAVYSFNAANSKLILEHINAGFNCCPGNITCTISVSNDTIIIQEAEEYAQCECNCLYDLEIEINNIESRTYWIRFIEPYRGDQEQLKFSADLQNEASGSYCVTRNVYPWGL